MKKKILLLGKLPPPYMGPAVATGIILGSRLKETFTLLHLDTRLNKSVSTIGRFSPGKVFKIIGLYLELVRLIRSHRPDLVLVPISQSSGGFLKDSLFILAARLWRRKVLLHLRGSNLQNWLKGASPVTRGYVEWVIRRSQGAIVLGRKLRYLFAPYLPAERIFVVPNGGDYSFPPPPPEAGTRTRVLYLANLRPSKGIADVVEAVRLLHPELPGRFDLDVVGQWVSDDLRRQMTAIVARDNLPVTFHPPADREKKMQFLARADIFVFPPREPEGHPWVIVEAMAAGLPVISTDQGAISESVLHGRNGFIVEPQNPAQVAEKLKALILDPQLRENMGRCGKALHREHFSEEQMVRGLTGVFNEMIENRCGRRDGGGEARRLD